LLIDEGGVEAETSPFLGVCLIVIVWVWYEAIWASYCSISFILSSNFFS